MTMTHRRMLRSAPTLAFAAAAMLVACKKPVPDETVFTGTTTPNGGSVGQVDASAPVIVDAGGGAGGAFTKPAFLSEMAACAESRVAIFAAKADALEAATATLAGAGGGDLAASRTAWLEAFAAFQELELFRIGPAQGAPAAGAMGLRDELYAWPLSSRCRVDEQLVSKAYEGASFFASLVNGRGLASLDYLLFATTSANGCSAFSTINASGTWALLAPTELASRKSAYAARAAHDVASHARALRDAWSPAAGNFQAAFSSAGHGSLIYPTEAAALNTLTDAVLYLDDEVKDWKLGKPLGFYECTTGTCPDAVEAPFSRQSASALKANLTASRRMVQGCATDYAGLGLDDWLVSIGAGELAGRMLGALVAAQDTVSALDAPVDDMLTRDPTRLAQAHANVRAFTTLMKYEVLPALTLAVPAGAQGDAD